MKQVLHILRKDIRHHWMEILLSVAALIATSVHEVHGWRYEDRFGVRPGFWSIALPITLVLTWWFLIVRVVQGETLVGDRQFWITRPYEWKKLLAAKVIFILLFVNVPCYAAALFFLIQAGFNPMLYLGGLLWLQLYLILLPLLPMVALAVVTRNIVQSLLAGLALILYMAGMMALEEVRPVSSLPWAFDSDWIQGALMVAACILVIGLQYVRRKTALARALLVITGCLIAIVDFATPYIARGERLFLPPSDGGPISLHAVLDPKKPSPPRDAPEKDEAVEINVPIIVSGLPNNSVAHVNGAKLSIEAPDAFRWNSNWEGYYPLLLPAENHLRGEFKMDNQVFERLRAMPVTASVSLALTIYRDGNEKHITATAGQFLMPGIGRCWIDREDAAIVVCRSPLQRPSALMRMELARSTCPPPQDEKRAPPPGAVAYDWTWGEDPGSEAAVNPILSSVFFLRSNGVTPRVCPGTPLLVSFPEVTGRLRLEFTVSDFRLDDYRQDTLRNLVIVPNLPKE